MKRSVKILWSIFWLGLLGVILIFTLANFGVFGKMPSLTELENPDADLASEIVSADGVMMGKYYSENRSEIKYDEIPQNVIEALIATEDQHFYEHSGVDATAVARAVLKLGTDGGGSPITQQLAKMILHQGKGNIFERVIDKLKEWIIAVKLERNFTKNEILTLYLNRAAWGNYYGIRNASRVYFQKEPKELKTEEAAVLIGMLKGFVYNPISRPDAAIIRRNVVIQRMVDTKQHYITQAEADKLKAKPLITNYKKIDEEVGLAPYYRRSLLGVLKTWCSQHTNPKTGEPYDLYRDGLKIYTTIDSRLQKYAEEATEKHMPLLQARLNSALRGRGDRLWKGHERTLEIAMKFSERWKEMKDAEIPEDEIRKSFSVPVKMKVFDWKGGPRHERDTVMTPMDSIKYQKLIMQTSFVSMDPKTGEIKAYVGGIDYRWFKFDNASAMRQVGSTFKPLLYTLAVTDAGYTPETGISGGCLTLSGKTICGGGGTMARCLAMSINSAAWHLMAIIGPRRTVEFAHQCGISVKIPSYPSIALGAAEIPLVQMLQSYTMFPNKGYNTEPVYLSRIEDKNGNLIHEFPLAQSKQVIGENDAYTMVKMMQGVVQFGTARRLNSYKIPVEKAGKTGTTDDYTDGWFIGYTPDLLAGTWVGCSDPFIPIYNSAGGAEMSAPRWGMFMEKVYANTKSGYGEQTKFDIPVALKDAPISADPTYLQDVNRGNPVDDLNTDNGNGDAGDFFGDMPDDNFGAIDTPKSTPKPTTPKPATQAPATTPKPVDPQKAGAKKPVTKEPANDF